MYKFIGYMVLGLLGFAFIAFSPITFPLAVLFVIGKIVHLCFEEA